MLKGWAMQRQAGNGWQKLLPLLLFTMLGMGGCASTGASQEEGAAEAQVAVSYTHLTLPTTPYV
jgi:phospholipid-binding lipoprotein MlaA